MSYHKLKMPVRQGFVVVLGIVFFSQAQVQAGLMREQEAYKVSLPLPHEEEYEFVKFPAPQTMTTEGSDAATILHRFEDDASKKILPPLSDIKRFPIERERYFKGLMLRAASFFDEGKYDECVKTLNGIFMYDPYHEEAQALRSRAEGASQGKDRQQEKGFLSWLPSKKVSAYEAQVKKDFKKNEHGGISREARLEQYHREKNYDALLAEADRVLQEDPGNALAKKYRDESEYQLEILKMQGEEERKRLESLASWRKQEQQRRANQGKVWQVWDSAKGEPALNRDDVMEAALAELLEQASGDEQEKARLFGVEKEISSPEIISGDESRSASQDDLELKKKREQIERIGKEAHIRLSSGDLEGAENLCDEIQRIDRKSVVAKDLLSQIKKEKRERAKAEKAKRTMEKTQKPNPFKQWFDKVREVSRVRAEQRRLARLEKEMMKKEKILNQQKQEEVSEAAERALQETEQKQVSQDKEAAPAQEPEKSKAADLKALLKEAERLERSRKYDLAIQAYEQVLALDSKNKAASKGIDRATEKQILEKEKSRKEKRELFDRQLQDKIEVYRETVQKLMSENKFDEALVVIQKGLVLDPDNKLLRRFKKEADQAFQQARKESSPAGSEADDINGLVNKGIKAYLLGNYHESREYFEQVLLLSPDDEKAKNSILKIDQKIQGLDGREALAS